MTMKFDAFARKVTSDPNLAFELLQTAWRAQRKIRGQISDGDMPRSRAEYDALMRFFEGVEDPLFYRSKHPDFV